MDKKLTITIEGDAVGPKMQISITTLQNGFQIRNQVTEKKGDLTLLHLTISKGKVPEEELVQALLALPGVQSVTGESADTAAEAIADAQAQLGLIATTIAQAYPNMLAPLRKYEASLPSEIQAPMMYEVGRLVGEKIYISQFPGVKGGGTAALTMEQFIARAIKPFAIVKTSGPQLELPVCPFSVNPVSSGGKECEFLKGLIDGLFEAIPNAPQVHATKVYCRARGDATCRFHSS